MTRLIILLALASLACGMTATIPSSDGHLGGNVSIAATVTDTPKVTFSTEAESVFVVTADVLTVRVCPAQQCQVAYRDGAEWYLRRGDVVMGGCYTFGQEVWLGFDHNADGEPTKFAAVLYDGQTFMKGNCNG